jgi:hypothetical protein
MTDAPLVLILRAFGGNQPIVALHATIPKLKRRLDSVLDNVISLAISISLVFASA